MKRLNRLIIVVFLVSIGANLSAQEIEIEDASMSKRNTFNVEVDRDVFADKTINIYSTSDFKSTLVVMKQEVSYLSLKNELKLDLKKVEHVTVEDKGELMIDKVNVLFVKYETEQEGVTYSAISYYKENSKNSVIGIIIKYPKDKEAIFLPIANRAIVTAKLN